jgi:hypothetical protein
MINKEVIGFLMVAKVRLTFFCPSVQIQLFGRKNVYVVVTHLNKMYANNGL